MIAVLTASAAQAQTIWNNPGTGDWVVGSNWLPLGPPTGADDANIDNGGTAQVLAPGAAADNLIIGLTGGGTLEILNGGTLSNTVSSIAANSGSTGTVTVTGNGSSWTNSATLVVGNLGTGMLTIEDGGAVSNVVGVVSNQADSQGTVTVSGANSTWTNSGFLAVGETGTGSLTIENGGTVSNTQGYVGDDDGSEGTVTVTGQNATWANSGDLFVGNFGTGTLTIEDGGAVSNTAGYVGFAEGSQGTVTVTGAGSTWTNSSTLLVGRRGIGTLRIEDGGQLSNTAAAYIGDLSGSSGTVTVTGAGSTWTNTHSLNVGNNGTGALAVSQGGTVSNATAYIGDDSGGVGTVMVTGEDSTWTNSGIVYVGFAGTGTLRIEDGGLVNDAWGYIGSATGSSGIVTVTGGDSTWTHANDLVVGSSGTGTLTIEDGGIVSNATGIVGNLAGSQGTVTVSGADADGTASTWTNSGSLIVGRSGTGALTVSEGGTVSNTHGYIGDISGSSGTVTVTGGGSTWTNHDTFFVGVSGVGELTIEDGATVSVASYSGIGNDSDSNGVVTVTGEGSTWANAYSLTVGGAGIGTLTVESSGVVSSGYSLIGYGTEGVGTVTVSGAGSTWANTGDFTVGDNGTGTLTIADGGTVATTGLSLATGGGSSGTLNIGSGGGAGILDTDTVTGGAGSATLNFNHADAGYFFTSSGSASGDAIAIAGSTTVNQIGTGTTVLTGANTYTGDTNVNAGTLLVEGSLGNTATTVAAGATLGGSGSLAGTVMITDGGMLAPGSSAGTLTVGALTLNGGSTLDFELGQAGVIGGGINDLIEVTGDLTLDGTLDITDIGGFGAGVYRLINYGGDLTDNGLEFGDLPAGVTADGLAVQTAVANQVNLLNSGGVALQFWDGDAAGSADNGSIDGGDGTWTALTNTWTSAQGDVNGPMIPEPGFAIFQSVAGTVTADDSAGHLAVTGMQFASDGYRIEGDAITLAGAGSESVIRVGDGTATGAAYVATIASELTGTSSLVKTDLGTLVLTGNNSYAGGTTITAGTLRLGHGGSIVGDVAIGSSATLAVERDDLSTLAGNISGGGGFLNNGFGVTVLTGTNTYTGGTTVARGTLQIGDGGTTGSIVGDIVNNQGLAINRSDTYAFDGEISGIGSFTQRGAGTTILIADSDYSGQTTVLAGTLQIDGSITNSNVFVRDGGTLGGSGTVGTTTIETGGSIAPGNSIGTLTVAGDYTQEVGSTYVAEIAPDGDSDLIDVTGTATIEGGTVFALKAPGGYSAGTRYTILTAGDGVTGSYDVVDQNAPFVDLALAYDPTAIYLDVTRNDTSFCDVAFSANQCAVGDGAESLGSGNPVYDSIAGLPDDESARDAFDQLSGEIHASIKGVMLEDSRFVREAAMARIRATFDGPGASYAPVLAYGPGDAPTLVSPDHTGPVFWSHGFGSWSSTDGDGNAASLDHETGGLFIGADAPIGDWRVGALAGFSHSSFDIDDRAASGSSDNYHLGIYGGTQWGALGLRAGAAYTRHDVEAGRAVSFPGFADRLSADYGAGTTQVFGKLGYRVDTTMASFEPFANIAYVNVDTDGFTEDGAAAALSSQSSNTDTTLTTLGLRASTDFTLGTIDATLHGTLGWRHAFGDTMPTAINAFAGGGAFTITGAPIAEDAAVVEVGLDLSLSPGANLDLSYSGQIASDAREHGFKAQLGIRF